MKDNDILIYSEDYCSSFTDKSYVTKKYVDKHLSMTAADLKSLKRKSIIKKLLKENE